MKERFKNILPINKQPKKDLSSQIAFFNRYSLLFHALFACTLVLVIEICSRRSILGAFQFVGGHTFAFFFNALIIFATLSFVYLFRRRALICYDKFAVFHKNPGDLRRSVAGTSCCKPYPACHERSKISGAGT